MWALRAGIQGPSSVRVMVMVTQTLSLFLTHICTNRHTYTHTYIYTYIYTPVTYGHNVSSSARCTVDSRQPCTVDSRQPDQLIKIITCSHNLNSYVMTLHHVRTYLIRENVLFDHAPIRGENAVNESVHCETDVMPLFLRRCVEPCRYAFSLTKAFK